MVVGLCDLMILSAAAPQAISRHPSTWLLLGFPAVVFLIVCAGLIPLAAPEHDDFCSLAIATERGFVQALLDLYFSSGGRLTALALIQFPAIIISGLSVSILTAYALVLAAIYSGFLMAAAAAFYRGVPNADVAQRSLLIVTFAATSIAVAPSPRELLYWLPGAACYVPPAAIAILFLAELFRLEKLSAARATWLAVGGFVGALCNEFSGVWLLLILSTSGITRWMYGENVQLKKHVAIAGSVLAGFLIIVMAPGNGARRSVLPNSGHLWRSLWKGLLYSIDCLAHFISNPAVIACLLVVALTSTMIPAPANRRRSAQLAMVIIALCLTCCYFEFFAHEYASGMRLVERAQNEALIFLLFGASLTVSRLASAYAPRDLAENRFTALALTAIIGVCLFLSPTGLLLRTQAASFYPFHLEAMERDRALRETTSLSPVIPHHKFTPSLLFGVDLEAGSGCRARYYGKEGVSGSD